MIGLCKCVMKYQKMFSVSDNDSRNIILQMIKPNSCVLEFGCANGNMTRYMSEQMNCAVYIVEYEKEAFQQAITYAVDGVCGDILEYAWMTKFETKFDYVIFADVLEHLAQPQQVLEQVKKVLKYDGSVLISVPNIAHNDILIKLFNDEFEYTPTGILDDTHIHFFTNRSLEKCCNEAGYNILQKRYTVLNTGTTEQGIENSSHILRNLLRERHYGNVYQNIVELKTKEYFREHSENEISELFVEEKLFSKIYLDSGNGYDEEHIIFVESIRKDKGEYECRVLLNPDTKLKGVRFDPIEAEGCLIKKFKFLLMKKKLNMNVQMHL